MNELQVLFSTGSLALLILICFAYVIKSVKSSERLNFIIIFIIGGAGWTGAFFIRLIPLGLIQVFVMIFLGAELTEASILLYSYHPLVFIWGPIFAGLFEEIARFICIITYKKIQEDPKRAPFMLGLGWTTAEIFLLFFLPIFGLLDLSESVALFLLLPSIVERITASVFHITMSYIVFYAIYEWPFVKKFSLWIAILFHFLLDAIILLWYLLFADLGSVNPALVFNLLEANTMVYIWSLEGAFALFTVVTVLFTWKYWIPRVIPQSVSCPQCGKSNVLSKFCIYCGAPLMPSEDSIEFPETDSENS